MFVAARTARNIYIDNLYIEEFIFCAISVILTTLRRILNDETESKNFLIYDLMLGCNVFLV